MSNVVGFDSGADIYDKKDLLGGLYDQDAS